MRKGRYFIFGLFFILPFHVSAVCAQETGAFSSYLVGTYDLRKDRHTLLHIINPTGQELFLYISFYDYNGTTLKCIETELSPNGRLELTVKADLERWKVLSGKFGVVKIISLTAPKGKPLEGIVGFQSHYFKRRFFGGWAFTESNLASLPTKVLVDHEFKELKRIMGGCPQ